MLTTLTVAAEVQETLFTINRTNYKPYKTLQVDFRYFASNCTLPASNESIMDVYYINQRNGSRIDMSSTSQQYFGPKIISINDERNYFEFTMSALEKVDVIPAKDRKVIVELENSGGECLAFPQIYYKNEFLILDNITIKMKKIFGLPVGIKKIKMRAIDERGVERVITLRD